jgi:hypothetical protein
MSIPFQKGEMALICRGPFAGKRGTITRIDAGSVTVMCDVFDRDTAVEVALGDVGPPPAPRTSGHWEQRPPVPPTGSAGAEDDLD